MSDSKCFCHFNGFEVKDAKSREEIFNLKESLESTNEYILKVDNRVRGIIACDDETEGNTELIDIRHGINGYNYPTAGDAVRDQIANIDKYFKSYNLFALGTESYNLRLDLENLSEDETIGFLAGDSAGGYCVGGINTQDGTKQEAKPETCYTSNALDFVFLNESGHYISHVSFTGGTNTFQTPANCTYIVYDWDPVQTLTKDIFLCEGHVLNEYSAELSEHVALNDKHRQDMISDLCEISSNAVKNTISDKIVYINDVSPLPHKMRIKTNDGAADNIKIYGKNILSHSLHGKTLTNNGITFVGNDDGSITITGTTSSEAQVDLDSTEIIDKLKDGVRYKVTPSVDGVTLYIYYINELGEQKYAPLSLVWKKEYTLKKIYIQVKKTDVERNLTFYPQIEIGSTATEYEQYRSPETYTTDSNGVLNLPSSCQPMTLIPDRDVSIEVDYNRDINKTIQELQQAIAQLSSAAAVNIPLL